MIKNILDYYYYFMILFLFITPKIAPVRQHIYVHYEFFAFFTNPVNFFSYD